MRPARLTRHYSRSVPYQLPDGREVWTRHEAGIEIDISQDDEPNLPALYKDLEDICIAEVTAGIKRERERLEKIVATKKPASPLTNLPKV